jgi:hypothetical protein
LLSDEMPMSAKSAMKPRKGPPDNVVRGHVKRLLRSRGEPEVTLCNLVEDVMEERQRGGWGRRELGLYLKVTYKESVNLNVYSSMLPLDVTEEYLRGLIVHRRQERDRLKKQRKRRAMRDDPNPNLSARARDLAAVLAGVSNRNGNGWMRLLNAVDQLRWRRASGRPLKRDSLAKAVQRAALELCRRGIAEQKVELGRGQFPTRFLRPIPAAPAEVLPRTLSSKTKTRPLDRRDQQTSVHLKPTYFLATIIPPQNLYTEGTRLAERPEEVAEGATLDRPKARPEGIASGECRKSEDLAVLGDGRRDVRVTAVVEIPNWRAPPAKTETT